MIINENELEVINEEFPTKEQTNGSLGRKRTALKKKYLKNKKLHNSHSHFGYVSTYYMLDKNGNFTRNIEDAIRFDRIYRPKTSKKVKSYCNRRLRRSSKLNSILYSGNNYRKVNSYEWDWIWD